MSRYLETIVFSVIALVVSMVIYGDALIGRSLLAPLDIGPEVFEHFQFMDEDAKGIPDNHYIIDQFSYDLPLQKVMYDAYREGEIPWWDPYTYGGRPLLADAHVNGTDPLRLFCYKLLPFELAYNWNYVLRGLIAGIGIFLVLRRLEVRMSFATVLGISYVYAGWFMLFFGHPWIAGSFVYFPFLWLVWNERGELSTRTRIVMGSLLCAAVFYSGNLQSHLYLPTFGGVLLLASCWSRRRLDWGLTGVVAASGIIGVLLASPVIWNQLEFFSLSGRPVAGDIPFYKNLLNGVFLGGAIYPWGLGTFRTLDAGKVVHFSGVGYVLFAGVVISLLFLVGFLKYRAVSEREKLWSCQARLMMIFFMIMAMTPLVQIYYFRSAALAGMAIIVLVGLTVEALVSGRLKIPHRVFKVGMALFLSGIVLLQIAAFVVYPRMQSDVEEIVLNAGEGVSPTPSLPALRRLQIDNFAKEVSVLNPEAAISVVAILLFGWIVLSGRLKNEKWLAGVLIIGAIPLLMYFQRFRPKHDIALWKALEAGGAAQIEVQKAVEGGKRYEEPDDEMTTMVFPFAYPAFYGVRAIEGYSALQPKTFKTLDMGPEMDVVRADVLKVSKPGEVLKLKEVLGSVRYRLDGVALAAPVRSLSQSLNSELLDVSQIPKNVKITRTDTHYPGWSTIGEGGSILEPTGPSFSTFLSAGDRMRLLYRPSSFRIAPYLVGFAALLLLVMVGSGVVKWRKAENLS